jgi:hypothetical protein
VGGGESVPRVGDRASTIARRTALGLSPTEAVSSETVIGMERRADLVVLSIKRGASTGEPGKQAKSRAAPSSSAIWCD